MFFKYIEKYQSIKFTIPAVVEDYGIDQSPLKDEVFLEIKDLHLDFSVHQCTVQVLEGIELSMKSGKIFGVVRETGCGKTVTTRSIVCLFK